MGELKFMKLDNNDDSARAPSVTWDSANEERLARDVANIIGPASAAAQALAELKRLRDAGHTAELRHVHGHTGGSWLVHKLRAS